MAKNIKSMLLRVIVGAVLIVLAISLFSGYSIYMEYHQIKEIGGNFLNVFFTNFNSQLITQITCFSIVFFIILVNLMIVRYVMMKTDISFSYLKNIFPIVVLAFVFAFFASGYIKNTLSARFLLFSNSENWGVLDPVFRNDLSYYVFQRPFLMALADSILGIVIFTTVMISIIYIILYSSLGTLNFNEIVKIKGLVPHVLSNIIIVILVKALSYKFNAEDILYNSFVNGLTGAGYTDINIWLKFNQITPIILVILSFLALILLYKGKFKSVIISILVYPALFLTVAASALFVKYFIVAPSEAQAENPYIQHNIEFTRMAYGLDRIEEIEFKAENNLTAADLAEEKQTIDNARIIDYNSSLTIINQLQSLRNFYEFNDLDLSAYKINGQKSTFATSVRELKKTNSDTITRSYVNDKLRYTHGYGIVTTPVTQVSEEGHPIFTTRDIPLVEEAGIPKITEPRIYFGEYKDPYSIVNTAAKEFDYLEGERIVDTVYSGNAGIKLTPLNKILFSIYNSDYQLLVSKDINSESKILINKNVIDRVRMAAPFLTFDEDAYVLVDSAGRLKWIIDGYTQTEDIPYSQETIISRDAISNKKFNYIRNSVKAVVDAYDGTTTLYVVDESDKLIQVYRKIYPQAFSSEPLPEDLKFGIKYPEYLFKTQAEQLKRYHTTDTAVFYGRSDIWEFSYEKHIEESKRVVEPYYNMMNIGGDFGLVLMTPFTTQEKNNMVSWFAVGSDGDNYGKMTLYKFPQGKNVYGTMQLEERIDSNTEISKLMALWGTGDSNVIRGNIITLPLKDSLIYIEPIYITSKKNTFPELKMVIAAYGDKIAMETTLKKSLDVLFNGAPSTIPVTEKPLQTPSPTPVPSITPSASPEHGGLVRLPEETPDFDILEDAKIKNVTEAFNRVQQASKDNDWESFGMAMKELEEAVGKLND